MQAMQLLFCKAAEEEEMLPAELLSASLQIRCVVFVSSCGFYLFETKSKTFLRSQTVQEIHNKMSQHFSMCENVTMRSGNVVIETTFFDGARLRKFLRFPHG